MHLARKTFGNEIFSSLKVLFLKLIGSFGNKIFHPQYFQQQGISEKANFVAKKQISSPKVTGDEKSIFSDKIFHCRK